jgi:DNA-directed RNA polymerase specialized sigma24 family protein
VHEGDRELVLAARAGDEDAFAELGRLHRSRARAAAHVLVRDPDEAEDVAQDALLQAYLRLETLRDPARFGA